MRKDLHHYLPFFAAGADASSNASARTRATSYTLYFGSEHGVVGYAAAERLVQHAQPNRRRRLVRIARCSHHCRVKRIVAAPSMARVERGEKSAVRRRVAVVIHIVGHHSMQSVSSVFCVILLRSFFGVLLLPCLRSLPLC